MNIFFATGTNNGCAKWRAEIPAKYLSRRGHTVQFLGTGQNSTFPDAIVFARTYRSDVMSVFHWCKKRGVLVVYDTDDALDIIDPSNPSYTIVREGQKSARYLLAHADVVTTTTPTLAHHLRQSNPNVVVLPNSVDPEEWKIQPRIQGGGVRVGWTGGSTHFPDLALVLDALTELQRKTKFTFVVQGLTENSSVAELYRNCIKKTGGRFRDSFFGRSIKMFLDKTRNLDHEFHPFVDTGAHAEMVCNLKLDIGIAPLAETLFNSYKSCIKYYEYAMSGAVTLASDVIPYSMEVPELSRNEREAWKDRLGALIESDRPEKWAQQYEWVMKNRNMEHNVDLWEQVFTRSVTSVTGEQEAAPRASLASQGEVHAG